MVKRTTRGYDAARQRRQVMLAMILMTLVGGLFFAVANFQRGLTQVALLQLVFVVYSLIFFPIIRRTPRLHAWSLIYLLPWIGLMVVVLANPQSTTMAFIWPLLLPLVYYFLLGRRAGLLLSLFGLSTAALVAGLRFGLPQSAESLVYAGNFIVAGIGVTVLAHVYERARELAERDLHRLAVTDPLTGLANRSLLNQTYARLRAIADRQHSPLSLLVMDLDHFKQINDRYGHEAGDQVLVEFARFIDKRLRESDFICRTGGEEFLVLLPGSDLNRATGVAEHIRRQLEESPIAYQNHSIPLTLSIGVAGYGDDGRELEDLIRAADQRLYQGKQQGRNRVENGLTSRA